MQFNYPRAESLPQGTMVDMNAVKLSIICAKHHISYSKAKKVFAVIDTAFCIPTAPHIISEDEYKSIMKPGMGIYVGADAPPHFYLTSEQFVQLAKILVKLSSAEFDYREVMAFVPNAYKLLMPYDARLCKPDVKLRLVERKR